MELFALALFVLSTSGTPGPNNVMIMTSGVNHGVKKSIPHVLGVNLGFPFMIIGVGLGIVSLFEQLPWLYSVLKVVGVLYLTYLAYKIATLPVKTDSNGNRRPFSFFQAASFQWVNPKAWVMAVSAIVAFSSPEGSQWLQLLTIALFYVLFGLPCSLSWLFMGRGLKHVLSNEKYVRGFNLIMACVLMVSIVPMIQELISGASYSMGLEVR